MVKEKKHSRFKVARALLIFWCLFVGLGAISGSACMLIDPSGKLMGMDPMLPLFQVLPFADVLFQNFIFPGISLLIVNGLTNMTAAFLLLSKKEKLRKAGALCGMIFGITLMLWITIQFIIFPANLLSTLYFIFGIIQAITGYAAFVFFMQEQFVVSADDYKNIGSKGDTLVVFFSRMGYVKKVAYERANAIGADVCELKSSERTDGTAGFWWCGRYAMHKWDMPVLLIDADLTKYQKVVIVTPVWAFSLCAPMRAFLRGAKGKIKSAEYIIVHHTRGNYLSVAEEMDGLLGVKREKATSLSCRLGKIVDSREI